MDSISDLNRSRRRDQNSGVIASNCSATRHAEQTPSSSTLSATATDGYTHLVQYVTGIARSLDEAHDHATRDWRAVQVSPRNSYVEQVRRADVQPAVDQVLLRQKHTLIVVLEDIRRGHRIDWRLLQRVREVLPLTNPPERDDRHTGRSADGIQQLEIVAAACP